MEIFNNSLIGKSWILLKRCYASSIYHKFGLFSNKTKLSSKTNKFFSKSINKTPNSHNANLSYSFISIIRKPFKLLNNYAKTSSLSKILTQLTKDINSNFIFSFLIIIMTFSLGLNISYFIKGQTNILYTTIFIVSIISLFIFIRVEKYIKYSFIYKIIKAIFS